MDRITIAAERWSVGLHEGRVAVFVHEADLGPYVFGDEHRGQVLPARREGADLVVDWFAFALGDYFAASASRPTTSPVELVVRADSGDAVDGFAFGLAV